MMPLLKLLVCGGRDYTDRAHVFDTLDAVAKEALDPFILIEGGAQGADRLAAEWAAARGNPHARVAAHWDFYGRRAGSLRNEWMLGLVPDLLVAFPGGIGTANMRTLACYEGVPIRVIEPRK